MFSKYSSPQLTRYHGSDQNLWNSFSEENVKFISQSMQGKSRPTSRTLFSELGQRRQEIAKKLNHNPARQQAFGAFRKNFKFPDWEISENRTREELSINHEYFKRACEYCDSLRPAASNEFFSIYSTLPQNIDSSGLLPDKSFKIVRFKGNPNVSPPFTLYYPLIDDELEENFFTQIDKYIDQLLSWNPADGLDQFFRIAGKLAYDTYRFLPFQLGTASIVNWLIRGLSLAKGIEIGSEKKDDLPVDWKAFFTSSCEAYSEWYKDNAYADIKIIENFNIPSEKLDQLTEPVFNLDLPPSVMNESFVDLDTKDDSDEIMLTVDNPEEIVLDIDPSSAAEINWKKFMANPRIEERREIDWQAVDNQETLQAEILKIAKIYFRDETNQLFFIERVRTILQNEKHDFSLDYFFDRAYADTAKYLIYQTANDEILDKRQETFMAFAKELSKRYIVSKEIKEPFEVAVLGRAEHKTLVLSGLKSILKIEKNSILPAFQAQFVDLAEMNVLKLDSWEINKVEWKDVIESAKKLIKEKARLVLILQNEYIRIKGDLGKFMNDNVKTQNKLNVILRSINRLKSSVNEEGSINTFVALKKLKTNLLNNEDFTQSRNRFFTIESDAKKTFEEKFGKLSPRKK